MRKQTLKTRYLVLMAFMLLSLQSFQALAQYDIRIEIEGSTDSVLYIGNYYLNGTYSLDTCYNTKGEFRFESKEKELSPGIYFFVNDNGKYCEFLVDKGEEKIFLETKEENWANFMKVKKSDVNKEYYEYIIVSNGLGKEIAELNKNKGSMSQEEFETKTNAIRETNDSLKNVFIAKNPDHLLTKVFIATKRVEIPEIEKIYKADGGVDSNAMQMKRYNYYIDHYFDNIDFQCDGLLRTPKTVFWNYYDAYWNEAMKYQTKDSIFSYAQKIIEKTRGSEKMFPFVVHNITERYLRSQYMGHDEIYVRMIQTYYETGEAHWMSPTDNEKEVIRANKWANSMLGKSFPDLACADSNKVVYNINDIDSKYKIVIFWGYDCGHCTTEIPKYYDFYKKHGKELDVEVIAINSSPDLDEWKKFINKFGLNWLNLNGLVANYDWHDYFDIEVKPVVFILDKNNKIIGKKVQADNIEEYIRLYDSGRLRL